MLASAMILSNQVIIHTEAQFSGLQNGGATIFLSHQIVLGDK